MRRGQQIKIHFCKSFLRDKKPYKNYINLNKTSLKNKIKKLTDGPSVPVVSFFPADVLNDLTLRYLFGGLEVPVSGCVPDGDGATSTVKGEVGLPLRDGSRASEQRASPERAGSVIFKASLSFSSESKTI